MADMSGIWIWELREPKSIVVLLFLFRFWFVFHSLLACFWFVFGTFVLGLMLIAGLSWFRRTKMNVAPLPPRKLATKNLKISATKEKSETPKKLMGEFYVGILCANSCLAPMHFLWQFLPLLVQWEGLSH